MKRRLFTPSSTFKLLDPRLKLSNSLQSHLQGRNIFFSCGFSGKESLHLFLEAFSLKDLLRGLTSTTTATKGRVEALKRNHLRSIQLIALIENRIFPPPHSGHVVRVEGSRCRASCDTAVATNEMLLDPLSQIT